MQLPNISIPQIEIPYEIPTLLHPATVHFVIALPIVILLLEIYNIFAKRKTIGAFSFILLLITIVMIAAAYITGTTDGKEAFDLLSLEGQSDLKAHKLQGAYIFIFAVVALLFKLFAMSGKGIIKFFYFIVLGGLIAIVLNQGKEGGELVYKYGANVESVKTLKEDLADVKDDLSDMEEESKKNNELKKVEVTDKKTIEKVTEENNVSNLEANNKVLEKAISEVNSSL